MSPQALVCGGGGFFGAHLVRRLKREGWQVTAADLVRPAFAPTAADRFLPADLRSVEACAAVFDRRYDEVYQFAADMGGAGFVFTGDNDWQLLANSTRINLNVIEAALASGSGRVFFASSACVYPRANQAGDEPVTAEDTAYPADPDSDYGMEKLFAERLYLAAARNRGLTVRIGRFHNVFGPECAWRGGREKAPAALCRKVAEAPDGGTIAIWGDGRQKRSFLFVEEALEGTLRLMRSAHPGPLNIGSEEMVDLDRLAAMVMAIAGKRLEIVHEPGPVGVQARRSDNRRISELLGWRPTAPLSEGLRPTYAWIEAEVAASRRRV